MWDNLIQWEVANHAGDIASIFGLLISFVGFFTTTFVAYRAEQAAREAVRHVKLLENVTDFSFALAAVEEVRRFQREGMWRSLPDRYAALRKALISIGHSNILLSNEQRTKVQSALTTIQSIEKKVERSLAGSGAKLDGAYFNALSAGKADDLQAILNQLIHSDVRGKNG